jgi:hypothetical protein
MGRARDISKVFSTGTSLATDTEVSTTYQTKAAAGLTLLNTTNFTAQSSVSLDNVFSATYDHYRLLLNITSATNGGYLLARLRVGGSDNTGASYSSAVVQAAFASGSLGNDFGGSTATSWGRFGYLDAGSDPEQLSSDIMSPFLTEKTAFYNFQSRPAYGHQTAGGVFQATTSFDGITIYPTSGTITGTVLVYGYNK